jgi:Na+-transporting NADH:ubiquinone oxidoreductase subunit F
MTEILLATLLMIALVLALSGIVIGARRVLQPAIPVDITLNKTRHIEGTTGDKLLTALQSADLPIPAACGGKGTCGLCRVTVGEGGGAPLPTEVSLLGPAEIRAGKRLSCQMVLRGPVSIAVPEDVLAVESFEARVLSNVSLAPLIKELVLELPEGTPFDYHAGAFAQITAPDYALDFASLEIDPAYEPAWKTMNLRGLKAGTDAPVSRAYSIANRPEDAGRIVMNIRLAVPPPGVPAAPPGLVSSSLFGLKPGDTVLAAGPFGDFRAQETDREMVFIGGGVGMAPLRAIIHDQLKRVKTDRKVSFFYGARSKTDLFYDEEFEALAKDHPNFQWVPALSDPDPDDAWEGATGFVHEAARKHYLADHPAPDECEYYLCGPPLMIRAVLNMLDEQGVEPESIFFDDFGT